MSFYLVQAAPVLIGERGNGGFFVGVVGYKEGVDEGGLEGEDVSGCGQLDAGEGRQTLVNWRSACQVRERG